MDDSIHGTNGRGSVDLASGSSYEQELLYAMERGLSHRFDPYDDVLAFHKKFGLEYEGPPRALTGELAEFRRRFLIEEVEEYELSSKITEKLLENEGTDEAAITHELEQQLDALLDELYVLLGTAILQGFNKSIFTEAWRRVHVANMGKVRAQSAADSKRGSTFDVVKPPGWTPPSHTDLVEEHAHRINNQSIISSNMNEG